MSTEESVLGSEAKQTRRDPWLSQYDDCLLDHAEDDALRKKLASGKKEILFKKVFHCHRAAKTKPVRPRKDGKPPPSSKKDICCRYEMWQVVLASDPEHTYFVEMHPHTGHDPATNPEEYRWLKTPAAIEDRVKDLLGYLSPAQVLDKLQANTVPGMDDPLSYLTLEKIYAIRKKWVAAQRLHENDKAAGTRRASTCIES